MIEKLSQYLKTHERLVIASLILIGVLHLGHWTLSSLASKAETRATVAEQTLATVQQTLASQASQNAKNEAQYQTMVDTLTKQNAALIAAISQDNASLAQRQAQDRALPLPALATRWQSILALPEGDLTANSNGIQVSTDGAEKTVSALEQIPVLSDQLSKETQVAQNNASLLGQSQTVNAGLTKQVGDLQVTLTDQQKQCTAQIAQVKADGNKKALRWAKVGLVIGGILGGFIGHAL